MEVQTFDQIILQTAGVLNNIVIEPQLGIWSISKLAFYPLKYDLRKKLYFINTFRLHCTEIFH